MLTLRISLLRETASSSAIFSERKADFYKIKPENNTTISKTIDQESNIAQLLGIVKTYIHTKPVDSICEFQRTVKGICWVSEKPDIEYQNIPLERMNLKLRHEKRKKFQS